MPAQPDGRPALPSILVSVDLDPDIDARLKLVAGLAHRFSSSVLGAAAKDIRIPVMAEGGVVVQADLIEEERRRTWRDLDEAEAVFRRHVDAPVAAAWRPAQTVGRVWLCEQARSADLVVCGARPRDGGRGGGMRIDPADVVMDLGRPLLVVPPRMDFLRADHIVVGWKNTREARRAVTDALPFLTRAESVLIVSFGGERDEEGANDVAEHLRRHGVTGSVVVEKATVPVMGVADELWTFASRSGADLVVCGAYGHGRLREWVFGGVTRDVLADTRTACLLAH